MSVRYAAEVENVLQDAEGSVRTVEVSVYGDLPGCNPAQGMVRNVSQYTKRALIGAAVEAGRLHGVRDDTFADLHYNVSICDGQDKHRVIFHIND